MDLARRCAVLAGVLALLIPSTAFAAQQTIAPPGKSGADQYFETIPSARGNVAPPSGGGAGGGQGSSSGAGVRSLAQLGRDGHAAAALAAATSPTNVAHRNTSSGANSSSPLSRFARVIGGSDSGGLGILLPVLLVAVLAVGLAGALLRLRRRDEPV